MVIIARHFLLMIAVFFMPNLHVAFLSLRCSSLYGLQWHGPFVASKKVSLSSSVYCLLGLTLLLRVVVDSPLKSNGYVCAFCSRSFQTAQRTATCHALWFLVSSFCLFPLSCFISLPHSSYLLPSFYSEPPTPPTALPLPAPIFKMSALSSTRPIALHEKKTPPARYPRTEKVSSRYLAIL